MRSKRSQRVSSPLLDDEDDSAEKQNEDHQTADAGPEDQTHVLGMLGYLQSVLGVLAGSWKMRNGNVQHLFYEYHKQTKMVAKLTAGLVTEELSRISRL